MTGIRIRFSILIIVGLFLANGAWAGSPRLELAWQNEGSAQYFLLSEEAAEDRGGGPLNPGLTAPLGSLWKLFMYVYLTDRVRDIPEYRCDGGNPKEEAFCCEEGGRVGADEALVRSCGPFFQPSRFKVNPDDWREYWSSLAPPSAGWLLDLARLQPETSVSVSSLLQALAAIPSQAKGQAEHALLGLFFTARGEGLAPYFGGRMRVKTWTWDHPEGMGLRVGGFAGWLADGTPIWVRGEGSSASILQRWAPAISLWLDTFPVRKEETECVVVGFFAGYPLKQLVDLDTGRPAPPGVLEGRYRVDFQNGRQVRMRSKGELSLVEREGNLKITGRLGLNEYVARVIDREASAEPLEAAKALAVAARTYLLQNAVHLLGCYQINDSSRTQRVSPSPPSEAARGIAAWTDGLIVKGVPIHYHYDQPGPNTMAWTRAAALAREKRTFDQILADAYPLGDLGSMYGDMKRECQQMPEAEIWLKKESRRWQQMLAGEPGFEAPSGNLTVCRLQHGDPYSNFSRKRLYVRGLHSINDRLALAHEYLHIGFRRHPRGADEQFIEEMAQRLIGE